MWFDLENLLGAGAGAGAAGLDDIQECIMVEWHVYSHDTILSGRSIQREDTAEINVMYVTGDFLVS